MVSSNEDVTNKDPEMDPVETKRARPPRRGNPRRKSSSRTGRDNPVNNQNFTLTNLSTALVCSKHYNQNLIDQSFRVIKDQTIVFKFKIKPLKERLEAQAYVWSRRIISDQKLYLKSILSAYPEDWENVLFQTFIYSYFSCVLYALTDSNVAEFSKDRQGLIGHSVLYHALLKPSFTFQQNGYFVRYSQVNSKEDLEYILNLAKEYPFINDYLTTEPRFYIENEVLDRVLTGLDEYMPSDGPKFSKILDEGTNCRYLTKDNFALSNSFYTSKSEMNSWFYAFKEGKSIIDSSTLYGKACFITSVEDEEVMKYFDFNNKSDDYYLVKYEVSAICGSEYPNFIPKSKGK